MDASKEIKTNLYGELFGMFSADAVPIRGIGVESHGEKGAESTCWQTI